jgi:breakpoint cluster region protein
MKAKTSVITNCQQPCWDADFEIDLDGAQTLRVLCYKKENDMSQLIGKGAFELSKDKLHSQAGDEAITLDNGMFLQTVMSYRSRQQTLKRTLSNAKEGLFGVRLKAVLRREGTKIPLIVTACVREIESRGMKDLGLYRVSGVLNEIQRLKKAFEKSSRTAVPLLKNADTNVIAGLLKVYLRELPEALFTDALYPKLVEGMALEEPEAKEKNLRRLMSTLPDSNYPTAMYILDHLIKVSEQESDNKMTLQNLATVFGPTLLRPAEKETSKQSVEELMSAGARDAMKQIEILFYILKLKQRGTFGVRL